MKKPFLFLSGIVLSLILVSGSFGIQNVVAQTAESDGRSIKLITIVTLVDPDRTVPKLKPGTYSYIFEACAGSQDIRGPEVILSSDSESKKVKLSHDLKANTCQTSVAKIKSSNKELITSSLVNRGGVSKLIIDLENKIKTIKEQLETQRKELAKLDPANSSTKDYKNKANEITEKIVKLRQDLNDARQQYYRMLYLLRN